MHCPSGSVYFCYLDVLNKEFLQGHVLQLNNPILSNILQAIAPNIFNYITSQVMQGGGSTLSPGEIPNVIDPIEGGTGLFGSYAKVTRTVFIRRPGQ